MFSKIIRNFIAKRVAGRSDDGIMISLKDPKKVDFQAAMMEDLLMRNGIDPRAIKSEAELKMLLNQISKNEASRIRNTDVSGIRGVRSGDVVDMEGKKIPPGSRIMGGKQVKNESGSLMSVNKEGLAGMEYDLPPPGSRGGADDIAAPVQSQEETLRNMTEAEIKREIEQQNKDSVKRILERKNREDVYGLEDYDTTNMSETKKQIIRLETRLGNLNPELPGFRDRARVLVDEIEKLKGKMRDDKADGGIMRLGFKDGMSRRSFLKILGGAMAIPIVGKILKPFKIGKKVTQVPIIKTDDVAGKPEWFDQLVNKVIIEGDEVTKRFATKDREIVHMKKIDDDNTVMVYQDLDEGAVRVDYDAPSNMGEDTVSLQYKKPNPDEGDPRPKAEFEASELEPRYVGGPEDADIEFDGLGGGSSIKMLESDVSKLKEYATGQKQTLKEFIESKKRKDAVKRINEDTMEQAEYIAGKYGDGPEPPDDIDFASGGIARMLGE